MKTESTEGPAPADSPLAPAAKGTAAYLTTSTTEEFGPEGKFHDLTRGEYEAAPKGLLVSPTPEQLAMRRV